MIAPWPPKPRYEGAKRLREAINARAQEDALADFMAAAYKSSREATARLQEMRDAITQTFPELDLLIACLHDNPRQAGRAQNIRAALDAAIGESDRS